MKQRMRVIQGPNRENWGQNWTIGSSDTVSHKKKISSSNIFLYWKWQTDLKSEIHLWNWDFFYLILKSADRKLFIWVQTKHDFCFTGGEKDLGLVTTEFIIVLINQVMLKGATSFRRIVCDTVALCSRRIPWKAELKWPTECLCCVSPASDTYHQNMWHAFLLTVRKKKEKKKELEPLNGSCKRTCDVK